MTGPATLPWMVKVKVGWVGSLLAMVTVSVKVPGVGLCSRTRNEVVPPLAATGVVGVTISVKALPAATRVVGLLIVSAELPLLVMVNRTESGTLTVVLGNV